MTDLELADRLESGVDIFQYSHSMGAPVYKLAARRLRALATPKILGYTEKHLKSRVRVIPKHGPRYFYEFDLEAGLFWTSLGNVSEVRESLERQFPDTTWQHYTPE